MSAVDTVGADGVHGVLGHLLQFIRRRGFDPGERLPSERELAERFEISRNTVREALTVLESFRFVERRPSSGIYLRAEVTDPSLEALVLATDAGLELNEAEVMQSMETRQLLEAQAIRLCCKRRVASDLKRMKEILGETTRTIRESGNIADLDSAFHLAIVAGTRNDVLVRVVRPFYLLSGPRRVRYFADPLHARRSLADHRRLYAAIEVKDEAAAERLLTGHLGTVEEYWRAALKSTRAP